MKTSSIQSIAVLSNYLGILLTNSNLSICVAESCTGGLIGGAISAIPGSSVYFTGGVIAYSNKVKLQLLGVKENTLQEKGAVSKQTAEEMAIGAARLFSCNCAIAVTGIAGPGGGTKGKPVGLVYIGIFYKSKVRAVRHVFSGNRAAVRKQTVREALLQMTKALT